MEPTPTAAPPTATAAPSTATTAAASPAPMLPGGWEYVWGAYGLTFAVLIGYALLTEIWYRKAERIRRMEDR